MVVWWCGGVVVYVSQYLSDMPDIRWKMGRWQGKSFKICLTLCFVAIFLSSRRFPSLKCQPSPPPNPQGARARETSEFRVSLARAPCGLGGGDG